MGVISDTCTIKPDKRYPSLPAWLACFRRGARVAVVAAWLLLLSAKKEAVGLYKRNLITAATYTHSACCSSTTFHKPSVLGPPLSRQSKPRAPTHRRPLRAFFSKVAFAYYYTLHIVCPRAMAMPTYYISPLQKAAAWSPPPKPEISEHTHVTCS